MKLLVDMNLSPRWVGFLSTKGVDAVHWSSLGDARASDATIMRWAVEHHHAVFTHDLDFSAILATAAASGPSVIQVVRRRPCLTRSEATSYASSSTMLARSPLAPS
jgi:predicted nuclease of predicted toxin-antitoxin system